MNKLSNLLFFPASKQPTSLLEFPYEFIFFFFDYSISHHFFLLFASTIALISGTYECSVIECEYPYSVFLFALKKCRNSNADLKVNSRNRIEWLKQIF